MSDAESPSLAFDDVVIDFTGRRLLRAGAPQALEPKAFAVLTLLARAPGQAFSRDEILDAVWGNRHVTPGVLNRVMTLLRHALGEEAQAPRYLHTLHGIGYRFDLPSATVVPRDETGERRMQPERRATAGEGCGRGTAAPSPATRPRWRALALGVVVVAALLAGGWWAMRRLAPPAPMPLPARPAATMPTIKVMPLVSLGADVADRELSAGLSDDLISALVRVDGLRVIARESTGLACRPAKW